MEQIDPFDDVQEDEEEDCSDSDNDEVVEVVWVDNCYWMYRKFRILLEIKQCTAYAFAEQRTALCVSFYIKPPSLFSPSLRDQKLNKSPGGLVELLR